MKRFKLFLTVLVLGLSAQSFAFIQAGLGGGYRGAVADKIGSGPEIRAFFHLDPIPFIPVSLGVGYTHVTISDLAEVAEIHKNIDLGQLDLELSAWLPFSIFSITPYVRVATPLYSFFVGEGAKSLDALSFKWFLRDSWSSLEVYADVLTFC